MISVYYSFMYCTWQRSACRQLLLKKYDDDDDDLHFIGPTLWS